MQGRRNGRALLELLAVELLLDDVEQGAHLADAHGLEQILVHARLNGALRIFEFAVSADDDDVNPRLQLFGAVRQLDPGHAVHADVRHQQVHGLRLKHLQRGLPADDRVHDLEL